MKRIINYFMIIGYDNLGEEQYEVQQWVCNNEEEFEEALNYIDENLILSIE